MTIARLRNRHRRAAHPPFRTVVDGSGFTLVELLVGMTVLAVLMASLAEILGSTQRIWVQTKARTEQYRGARLALETMARRISQATLNSYWDYRMDPVTHTPTYYERNSELHFVSGPASKLVAASEKACGHAVFFHAPFGFVSSDGGAAANGEESLQDLLNGWGYFVEYGDDMDRRPPFLAHDTERNPARRRFRLMELRLPADRMDIFTPTYSKEMGSYVSKIQTQKNQPDLYSWFNQDLRTYAQPLAENILAVIIQPEAPEFISGATRFDLAQDYFYDSRRFQWDGGGAVSEATRHQLPPVLRLSVIAADEAAWSHFSDSEAATIVTQLRELLHNTLFKQSDKFSEDLESLAKVLQAHHLDFRVFTTAVPLRAARWSL